MKSTVRRDLLVIVVGTLFAAWLCARFDVSEALARWATPHESLQLDELPAVMLVLAILLCWFSTRRYLEAAAQLRARRTAERLLAEALADNQRLSRHQVEMLEDERKALARDLHDELGQYLNAIKLDAVAARDAAASDSARASLSAMISNIDRVYEGVRDLIRQLRPVALDTLGFAAAMEHLAEQWRLRVPADIALDLDPRLAGLEEALALVLYRVAQEALTNVARHARAQRVRVRVAWGDESIAMRIEDDGCGRDLEQPRSGLGLLSMRERLAAVGGSLSIKSAPGRGFEVNAQVPCDTQGFPLISKSSAPELLVDAVRRVAAGERFLSPDVEHAPQTGEPDALAGTLPARGLEVLRLLVQRCGVADVAERLGFSVKTAANHQYSIKQKLGASSALQLMLIASQNGLAGSW